jgi:osmotically inducible protein OsmC
MPRIIREAEVSWEGNVARGIGAISAASSSAFSGLPYTVATRSGVPEGKTSPEELLAAAHGGCFTMSLASELSKAGTPPERLDVRCVVTMDEVEGKGHQIVHSEIEAHGTVPDCDEAAFAQAAEAADASCPFSALIRASATVSVSASLRGPR